MIRDFRLYVIAQSFNIVFFVLFVIYSSKGSEIQVFRRLTAFLFTRRRFMI